MCVRLLTYLSEVRVVSIIAAGAGKYCLVLLLLVPLSKIHVVLPTAGEEKIWESS